ncbi:MAG: hypothetical protein KC613_28285 [Myxococcales bacterium]|nr:hypothetical protein [Myxococcales bacterium]MCB9525955.1 hypothetical protein [Myxococcales bacterium]
MNTSMTPELGEAALFLIGILLSALLLLLLFLPFVTRFRLPRFARISGLDADAVVAALRAGLPRADMVVVEVVAGEAGQTVVARRPPNIFRLSVHPDAEGARLTLAQDGLTDADLARLTVLTGTALGYASVKIHRLLGHAGATLRWHGSPEDQGPGAARPVRGIRRLFVQLSPWH